MAMAPTHEKNGKQGHFAADIHKGKARIYRLTITGALSDQDAQSRLAVQARLLLFTLKTRQLAKPSSIKQS